MDAAKKEVAFHTIFWKKTFPRTFRNIKKLVGKLLLSLSCIFSVVGNSNEWVHIHYSPSCDLYQTFNFQTELYVVFEFAIVPAGVETQVF